MNNVPELYVYLGWLPPLVFVLGLLEIMLSRWMAGGEARGDIYRVALTHLPWNLCWSLVWGGSWFSKIHLPPPHDFDLRKIQIVFGIALISHLFLFARLLLSASYKNGWKNSKIFGVVALFVFVGTASWTSTVCDLSGDEPHYLLMAYSLIHDGDLDLSNNYQKRDYESFYHRGVLEPQGLEHVVDGRRYSHHPLGPVFLILPGFALLGRLGAAYTMAFLAALALFLSLRILEETGASGWALHVVGVAGLFSSPLFLFSGLIFPEVPTACLVALCLYLFLKKRWGLFGFCLGVLLWMHNRNVLLVIPLSLTAIYEILRNDRKKWFSMGRLGLGFTPPVAVLSLVFYHLYDAWTPLGAHNEPFTSLFRLSHFWAGFFGLVLDQECGLWFHFPVFAMMVTGSVILGRSRNPLRNPVLVTFYFFYIFMSFYENLGLTPATRYMVGVTPILLFLIYPSLAQIKTWNGWALLNAFSLAFGALVNWILAAVPWMRYNKLDGENLILKTVGALLHVSLTSLQPSFNPTLVSEKSYVFAAVWFAGVLFLSFLFLRGMVTGKAR